jgi:ArsR family transcriptional regulator, arsenate/arsenite/antimonite-responsive transcriptional repressor
MASRAIEVSDRKQKTGRIAAFNEAFSDIYTFIRICIAVKRLSTEPAFLFKTLADPTRLRLLNLLAAGETCVCELTDTLRVVQPKVSRHLARLTRAGLVNARRDGKWMYYRWRRQGDPLVRHVLGGLHKWMENNNRMNDERRRRRKVCCQVSRRKHKQTSIK